MWLWTLAGLMGVGCAAVIVWCVADPPRLPQVSEPASIDGSADDDDAAAVQTVSLEQYQQIWDLDLRQPLYDPPPPPVVTSTPRPQTPTSRPLNVQLVGTIMDSSDSRGIFNVNSQMQIKGLGDQVDGAKIVGITAETVTLLRNGERIVLNLPTKQGL